MRTNLTTRSRKIFLWMIVLILCFTGIGSPHALAQEAGMPLDTNDTISTVALSNGTLLKKHIINGSPVPPPGYELERQAVALPESDGATINAIEAGGGRADW